MERQSGRPAPEDFDRLNRTADLAGADRRYLVARVTSAALGPRGGVVSLADLIRLLRRLA